LKASTFSNVSQLARSNGAKESNIRPWKKEFENNPLEFGAHKRISEFGENIKHPDLEEFFEYLLQDDTR